MIPEAIIYKLLDLAFNALSVGLEREEIVARVKSMEDGGATPEEIISVLQKMRDEAIAAAQSSIDKVP